MYNELDDNSEKFEYNLDIKYEDPETISQEKLDYIKYEICECNKDDEEIKNMDIFNFFAYIHSEFANGNIDESYINNLEDYIINNHDLRTCEFKYFYELAEEFVKDQIVLAELIDKKFEIEKQKIDNKYENQIKEYEDQIKEYRDQIKEYRDQIEKYEDQIKEYEDQIKKCEEQIELLHTPEIQEIEEKYEQLKEKYQEKMNDIEESTEEYKNLKKEYIDKTKEIALIYNQYNRQVDEINEKIYKYREFVIQLEQEKEKIFSSKDYQMKLEQLNETINKQFDVQYLILQEKYDKKEYKDQIKEYEERIKEYEERIKEYRDQIEKCEKQIELLHTPKIQEIEEKYEQLKEKYQEKMNDIEESTEEYKNLKKEYIDKTKEIALIYNQYNRQVDEINEKIYKYREFVIQLEQEKEKIFSSKDYQMKLEQLNETINKQFDVQYLILQEKYDKKIKDINTFLNTKKEQIIDINDIEKEYLNQIEQEYNKNYVNQKNVIEWYNELLNIFFDDQKEIEEMQKLFLYYRQKMIDYNIELYVEYFDTVKEKDELKKNKEAEIDNYILNILVGNNKYEINLFDKEFLKKETKQLEEMINKVKEEQKENTKQKTTKILPQTDLNKEQSTIVNESINLNEKNDTINQALTNDNVQIKFKKGSNFPGKTHNKYDHFNITIGQNCYTINKINPNTFEMKYHNKKTKNNTEIDYKKELKDVNKDLNILKEFLEAENKEAKSKEPEDKERQYLSEDDEKIFEISNDNVGVKTKSIFQILEKRQNILKTVPKKPITKTGRIKDEYLYKSESEISLLQENSMKKSNSPIISDGLL